MVCRQVREDIPVPSIHERKGKMGVLRQLTIASAIVIGLIAGPTSAQRALPLASLCTQSIAVLGFDYSREIIATGYTTSEVRVIGPRTASCEMQVSMANTGQADYVIVLFAPNGTPALTAENIREGTFARGTWVRVTGVPTTVQQVGPHRVIFVLPTSFGLAPAVIGLLN